MDTDPPYQELVNRLSLATATNIQISDMTEMTMLSVLPLSLVLPASGKVVQCAAPRRQRRRRRSWRSSWKMESDRRNSIMTTRTNPKARNI